MQHQYDQEDVPGGVPLKMWTKGVPVEDERDAFIAEAEAAAAKAVDGPRRNTDKLREDIRLSVRKVATRWTGKKPIVDVLLIEG